MELSRIKEVCSDQEYLKELFNLSTPEEVQASLKEKGIDMTIDEINQTADFLNRANNGELTENEQKAVEMLSKSNGELSEEDLESVTGGATLAVFVGYMAAFGGAAAIGAAACVGLGFLIYYTVTGKVKW